MVRKNIDSSPKRSDFLEFIKLSIGSQFVVPVYQRNYTWTASREIVKFLDDFNDLLTKKKERHFMGIIMYLENQIDFKFREYSIIDGQQRLITLFLMLLAIRDICIERNINLAEQIENVYVINQYVEEKQKFKLKPLVSDDDVFSKIVEKRFSSINTIETQKSNVYKNYITIKDFLVERLKDFQIEYILESLEKFYIVVIPLIDDENAQQIFESINSTGVRLLSSDLIRNFMLMNVDSERQDILYKKYWHEIEKNIDDSEKLEEFFRIYLSIKKYQLYSKKELYDEFKVWFKESSLSPDSVLLDMLEYSKIFKNFISEDYEKEIGFIVDDFKVYDSNLPLTFLVEIINKYKHGFISLENLKKVNGLITSYLVRRSLTSQNSKTISRLFPSLLKNVVNLVKQDFSDIFEVTINFLVNNNKQKSSFMPDDKELINYLKSNNSYVMQITRSILDKIEHHNNSAPVLLNNLSVEHVMPQTKTSYWLSKIAPMPEEEYDKIVNLIGNLTLASKVDNSKMQNLDWNDKKTILKKTGHLKINQEILKLDDWNITEINNRSERIIKTIIDMFPYYSNKDNLISKKEIFINKPGVRIKAFIYESGILEVSKDSFFKKYSEPHPKSSRIDDLYKNLIDEGFIKELANEVYFLESYSFTSIEVATDLIIRNQEEIDSWIDNDGKSIY
jgi:uncharacterized protein with ParB-like and HNH nuclease domain